jgi:hypothetical protein
MRVTRIAVRSTASIVSMLASKSMLFDERLKLWKIEENQLLFIGKNPCCLEQILGLLVELRQNRPYPECVLFVRDMVFSSIQLQTILAGT